MVGCEVFERKIVLIGGGDGESGVLTAGESQGKCHIRFEYRGGVIEAQADDYFEALCQIREQLEKKSLIPFCYGASLNVYPSSLGRQVQNGLSAYQLAIGRHARDLVHIFYANHDVIPATVQRQKEFFDEWRKTPKT